MIRCYSDWSYLLPVHATCWEQRHVPWIMTNVISSLFSRLGVSVLRYFEVYGRFVWERDKMESELRVRVGIYFLLLGFYSWIRLHSSSTAVHWAFIGSYLGDFKIFKFQTRQRSNYLFVRCFIAICRKLNL